MKIKVKKYLSILIGLLFIAIAFNLFLSPYNYVTGGVSGLSIVVNHLIDVNESVFMFIMNLVLIGVSYFFLGKEKTKNTILGSLLFPVFVSMTEGIGNVIVLDLDPFIVACLGGILSGYGYGLVFQNNYTTGGTDILNQMMEKYFHIPMSKSILYVDGLIVFLGGFTFGVTNLMYSLIALALISYLSNNTQLGINKHRILYITSSRVEQIRSYLVSEGYDATILHTQGGYSKRKRKILFSSVHENDYYRIRQDMLRIDPRIFIVVTNAYEQHNANLLVSERSN